jgi:hypothetical protein
MNDADVIREVRERFDEVHMETSLDTVVSRGRSLRRRKRLPGLAAAAAAAGCIALAVAGILPGTGPRAALAAWTVSKKPTGIVAVSIRQLSNPAGLQRTLREDGVPATVRFNGSTPQQCLIYPLTSPDVLRKVFPSEYNGMTIAFTINPAAIPSGAALWIQVTPPSTNSSGVSGSGMGAVLVYASGRCPAPPKSGK